MKTRLLIPAVLLSAGVVTWFILSRDASSGREPAEPGQSASPTIGHSGSAEAAVESARGSFSETSRDVAAPDEPISARAVLEFASGDTRDVAALDGEFARVPVAAGEVVTVTLRSHRFTREGPIRVDAENGGSLNRRLGPIEDLVDSTTDTLSFTYAVGGHRGRYTVEISQGPVRELLEFWVGPEPPLGEPGPARTFSAPLADRG